jgi:TonB family protein
MRPILMAAGRPWLTPDAASGGGDVPPGDVNPGAVPPSDPLSGNLASGSQPDDPFSGPGWVARREVRRAAASCAASLLLHALIVAALLLAPRELPRPNPALLSGAFVRLAPLSAAPLRSLAGRPLDRPDAPRQGARARAPAPPRTPPKTSATTSSTSREARVFRRPRPAPLLPVPAPQIEAPQPASAIEAWTAPVPIRALTDLPRLAPSPVHTGEFHQFQAAPADGKRPVPAATAGPTATGSVATGFGVAGLGAGGSRLIQLDGVGRPAGFQPPISASPGAFPNAAEASSNRAVPAGDVVSGTFGAASVAHPAPVTARSDAAATDADFEAKILFKPRAEYSGEARLQHIEGDVLLQMVLTASGETQLVRVVHGLGHGLDQAAEAAARQIRFRPAQRSGVAVDSVVVVRIEFRLAY